MLVQAMLRVKPGTEPGVHKLLANYKAGFSTSLDLHNPILPVRFYDRTQTVHSSVTSKVHDVDLINYSTVSNAL